MSNNTPKPIQIPLPIEGATLEMPLSRGYVTVVDAVDSDLTQYKWSVVDARNLYAIRRVQENGQRLTIRLHRLIMERIIQRTLEEDEFVDHIDGDPVNNRRSNLRLATKSSNAQNAGRKSTNTTGYKGVCAMRDARTKKIYYRASISVKRKRYSLGVFRTPEEAFESYKKAAIKYHGEFHNLG